MIPSGGTKKADASRASLFFVPPVRVYNPSAQGGHFLVNVARKSAKSAQSGAAFTLALPSEADYV